MPDWEIKEWNESNLDINCNEYVKKAYSEKKYAFASDYFRFDILSKYGGLYMDTDVEIVKPFEDLLVNSDCIVGFEYDKYHIAPGLILFSSLPGNKFITEMRNSYLNLNFTRRANGIPLTICELTTEYLQGKGLVCNDSIQNVDGVTVYPSTYFCPTNKEWSVQNFSDETRCVHHYSASWFDGRSMNLMLKRCLFKFIGPHGISVLKRIRLLLKRK